MANPKSRSLWLWLILILVAGALIVRWDRQRSVQSVPMAVAERRDIQTGVVTNGKAEPVDYRDVRAEIEGQVAEVLVHDGDELRPGQKLLQIVQQQIVSEIQRARAQVAEAEEALRVLKQGGTSLDLRQLETQIELARRERDEAARLAEQNERLEKRGAVSRLELQQSRERLAKSEADLALLEQRRTSRFDPQQLAKAEAAVAAHRAALNEAESRQRSSSVLSPLRGTAYSLAVRPGDFVRPGDLLLRVGDFRKIRVQVYVDEPDLGRVTKQQPVMITWDGLPGKQWSGEVDRLPSEIKDLGTRKVGEVSCILDNPGQELLPNMNLNVEIITARKPQVLTVPREALFGAESNRQVYLVQEGRLVRRTVQTGLSTPTRVEIVGGLSEGDRVALASETPLSEGMRVRDEAS